MTGQEILASIGQFTAFDVVLFEKHTARQRLDKNELLLKAGEVCKSFCFILEGAFVQYQLMETDEQVVDLHLENEWMYNQESLTLQQPSTTCIRAFKKSEVLILSLNSFHTLCTSSPAFLQFGKIMNQSGYRTTLYDQSLSPAEKYRFIQTIKPGITQVFPLKLIASYLKITPETLSRLRANPTVS